MRNHTALMGLVAVAATAAFAAGCSGAGGSNLTGASSQMAPVVITLQRAAPAPTAAGAGLMADPGRPGDRFAYHGVSIEPSSLKVIVTSVSFLPMSADTGMADSDEAADSADHDHWRDHGDSSASDSADADSAKDADSTHADSARADSARADSDEDAHEGGMDRGWITVTLAQPDTIDLLALPADSSQAIVIATDSLPVGTYGKVRLDVNGGSVTFASTITIDNHFTFQADSVYPLTIPSGAQSGIKTNVSFTVAADSTGTPMPIQLIFDPTNTFAHLTVTGDGKIILSPVFHCDGPHD